MPGLPPGFRLGLDFGGLNRAIVSGPFSQAPVPQEQRNRLCQDGKMWVSLVSPWPLRRGTRLAGSRNPGRLTGGPMIAPPWSTCLAPFLLFLLSVACACARPDPALINLMFLPSLSTFCLIAILADHYSPLQTYIDYCNFYSFVFSFNHFPRVRQWFNPQLPSDPLISLLTSFTCTIRVFDFAFACRQLHLSPGCIDNISAARFLYYTLPIISTSYRHRGLVQLPDCLQKLSTTQAF